MQELYDEFEAVYNSIKWHEAEIARLQKIVDGNLEHIEILLFADKVYFRIQQKDTFFDLGKEVKMLAQNTINGYKEEIERLKNSL